MNTIQANGDFKFGVLPEEINEPLNLKLFGYDLATAGNMATGYKDYVFVKKVQNTLFQVMTKIKSN